MESTKNIHVNITYDPEKSFMVKLMDYRGDKKRDLEKSLECLGLEVEYVGEIEDKLLEALGEISIYDIGYISTALKVLTIALENAPSEDDESIRTIIEAEKRNMERVIRIDTIKTGNGE